MNSITKKKIEEGKEKQSMYNMEYFIYIQGNVKVGGRDGSQRKREREKQTTEREGERERRRERNKRGERGRVRNKRREGQKEREKQTGEKERLRERNKREREMEREKNERGRVKTHRKKGMMQQFREMITVRFMERDSKHSIAWGKTEQESKHNIKVVDEICIYKKVLESCINQQRLVVTMFNSCYFEGGKTRTKHAQFYIQNTKTCNTLSQYAHNAISTIPSS